MVVYQEMMLVLLFFFNLWGDTRRSRGQCQPEYLYLFVSRRSQEAFSTEWVGWAWVGCPGLVGLGMSDKNRPLPLTYECIILRQTIISLTLRNASLGLVISVISDPNHTPPPPHPKKPPLNHLV